MNYEELPKHLQDWMDNLKHGSLTIEADVKDALERAKDMKEFREDAIIKMDELIGEAKAIKEQLY